MKENQVKEEVENKVGQGDEQLADPNAEEQRKNAGEESKPENENQAPKKEEGPADEMNKLKEELSGAKDKYLRLYSEFENFRRRTAKEKLEMIQTANEQLLKSLLPVLDDFERAEKSFQESKDSNAEGFFLIQSKLKKVIELYSVKPMEVGRGTDFNADYHEAITQIPAPEPSLKGKVVDVVEKGYVLNEKVIRFAKVVVGS